MKIILALSLCLRLGAASASYTQHFNDIANPERGFTHYMDLSDSYTQSTYNTFKTIDKVTVVGYTVGLDAYRSSALPASLLTSLNTTLADARAAGIKMFLRFNYNSCAGCPDATEAWVLSHLDQLAPTLQNNADVIAFVEAGFVGEWGEWHDSTNSLTAVSASRTTTGQVNIINKLLSVVPERRMIAMRYNFHKRAIFGEIPLTVTEAFQGNLIPRSRIGSHNDCFVSGPDDTGSYQGQPSIAAQKAWLSLDNQWVAVAGETCINNPPYDDCGNSLIEFSNLRFGFINRDFDPNVINHWNGGGCLAEIKRRLGYRFCLIDSNAPLSASAGATITVSMNIANFGFSQPKNPRTLELVLRPVSGGNNVTLSACSGPMPGDASNSADARYWLPGTTVTVSVSGTLPAGMPGGNYETWLNLPDPEPALKNRSDYSIRLVSLNSLGADVWDSSSGMNRLDHVISIAGCALCTPTPTATATAAPESKPEILSALAVPNPNPTQLWVQLKGNASSIQLRLYSSAMACVYAKKFEGAFAAPWAILPFDVAELGNGSYALTVNAQGKGNSRCITKITVLR